MGAAVYALKRIFCSFTSLFASDIFVIVGQFVENNHKPTNIDHDVLSRLLRNAGGAFWVAGFPRTGFSTVGATLNWGNPMSNYYLIEFNAIGVSQPAYVMIAHVPAVDTLWAGRFARICASRFVNVGHVACDRVTAVISACPPQNRERYRTIGMRRGKFVHVVEWTGHIAPVER